MCKLKQARITGLVAFVSIMATSMSVHATVHYVKTGSNSGNGTSWTSAYATLDDPLEGSEWITLLDISRMPGTWYANTEVARTKGWNVTADVADNINYIGLNTDEVASVSYYTLSGMAIGSVVPQPGFYIVRITFTDGRTVSRKCFVK